LKNNLGVDQTGLAFRVEGRAIAGGIETSRVTWEAEVVTITADEAMAPQADPEERSALDDAMEFLRGVLADGAMPAKRIYADARDAGHSERTVRRAQKALQIEVRKDGKGPWLWALPAKVANNAEDGHTKTLDTYCHIGHLRPNGAAQEQEPIPQTLNDRATTDVEGRQP
jgi:hypothetical protein